MFWYRTMSDLNSDWKDDAKNWNCHTFSITWRDGTIANLLREVSARLDSLGEPEVHDIVFARFWSEENGELIFKSQATVYYD